MKDNILKIIILFIGFLNVYNNLYANKEKSREINFYLYRDTLLSMKEVQTKDYVMFIYKYGDTIINGYYAEGGLLTSIFDNTSYAEFNIPETSYVKVKILDYYQDTILTIIDTVFAHGRYMFTWRLTNPQSEIFDLHNSNGVYYFNITAENVSKKESLMGNKRIRFIGQIATIIWCL